jgi:hypothetical protein
MPPHRRKGAKSAIAADILGAQASKNKKPAVAARGALGSKMIRSSAPHTWTAGFAFQASTRAASFTGNEPLAGLP